MVGDKVLIQDTSSQSWRTCLRSSPKAYELHIFVRIHQVHLCRKTKATCTPFGVTRQMPSPALSLSLSSRNWWFRWGVQSEFVTLMMDCHWHGFLFLYYSTTKVKMLLPKAVLLPIKVSVAATKYNINTGHSTFPGCLSKGMGMVSRPAISCDSSSQNSWKTRTLQV